MTKQLEIEPDDERFLVYSQQFDEYGLQDRKDDEAYTPICFCPWCGTRLPSRFSPDEPDNSVRQSGGGRA
jgi:hypothetical protein